VVVLAILVLVSYVERLLLLVPGFRGLFDTYGYVVPRSLRSLVEIAIVLATVCLLHRLGAARGLAELGFRGPVLLPFGLGLAATAPMILVFAIAYRLTPELHWGEVVYLSLLSPLAEEAVFRGFAVGQLERRAGWPFWIAAIVPAALFGYGHAEGATSIAAAAGLFALTAVGALVFAWLFAMWGTLLAPLTLHVLMNLCWNVWQVGEGALAGWVPFVLQVTTVGLAIGLTAAAAVRGWLPSGSR
jgi:CAAX protease family protein